MRFVHDTLPQRVRFATGEVNRHLVEEAKELECSRMMVIAANLERTEGIVTGLPVRIWQLEVAMHVPVTLVERVRSAAVTQEIDGIVSIGGGSATGLAKAVALTTGLPIIAVPTTYAGSEATNVWGITEGGRKTTGTDDRVLPRTVVYDASLTLGLPVAMSVASGLNALAHCVDSMWAPRADPINAALAVEGIRALNTALPGIVADPTGLAGREQALYGAYLAAVAFASAGSGLHHKICHVLGGMFNLPHAQTHAIVLPHVLAFNGSAAPEASERIAAAFGAASAAEGLAALRSTVDAPVALRDLDMPEDGIPAAVEAVLAAVPAGNPVPVTTENLTTLLHAAWKGTP
jgi:maleylacetate reductase